ncbi:MAG: GEVED domain-containing protein, partial [Bacteroidales bacterium]|nr:GEVED domain-containing protein [Bacteroidales bacterium]
TAEGVGSNGTDYSELQDASLGMNTYGSGCQVSAGNSIADDFEVTEPWDVESFTFYSYQTGSGTTSTLNDVRCQIYDGNPSAGGTVIWGNLTTNLMSSTAWTNSWRVLESAPSENRPIYEIVADVTGLQLNPGTYWVEMMIGGTGSSGPWAPPITIVGETTTGNSIQHTSTGWAPLEDIGPQGLPFKIHGSGGQQFAKDVGVSAILQPATGVNLTATEAIVIVIRNYGTNAQSNIPWTVNWNGPTGAGSANGTFSGSIAPGETATVNLTQTANLSTYGDYTFTACTALSGDEKPTNDCKEKIVTNKLPEYCPASTTTQDEYISNVLCGTIDNSSGWQGGVADYTDIYTAIAAGQSEDITVTNGNPWSSDKVTCWVDWDMSYTFDEGDEKFVLTSNAGGANFTGAIAVPPGTPEGSYRMRVRMSYSSDPVPCGPMSYGEVEDYTIQVGEGAANDVGVSALNMGGFYQPGVVAPKATVKNYGSATQTFNVTMTIGSYTSTKSVTALVSGGTQEVTFDNWNATVGSYTAQACTQLAGDENPNNDCKTLSITVAEGNFVFAYNAYDPSGALVEGPVTFDIINPGTMNLLAPTSSGEFIAGATWANGTWYGCMYSGGLYTIDSQSGAMVLVGPSADFSGLAFDGTTMYGASVDALYSVDPATGQSTLIGSMGNPMGLMIGIACDADGNMYGYDIGDDIFYSINKTTGAATAIGPLGHDFNYAQDMAYDKVNGVCYLAGYTTTGGLYSVDVTTGAATFLAEFAGGAEITGFAIPGETAPPAGPAPIDFAANYVAGSGVETSWEMPEVGGQWKRWDDGTNWGSLGLEEAGTFWAAARWEPSDLTGLDGQYITEFEFYPMFYNNAPGIKLMIWEGAGAANLVYEQVLTGLTWDEFNTISLDQAHMIDASVELMVGFEITQPLGEYPIGYDEGPAVAGKGDLVSLDGINFVSMATEFEIDNNFNLGIYIAEEVDGMVGKKQILARNTVSNPSATFVTQSEKSGGANLAGTTRGLEGFNIYRDNVKVNANPISATARTYTDAYSVPGTYTYYAKAIYTGGLSDPSNSDEVTIPGGSDPTISVNPMTLTENHPNPPQITTKTLTVTNAGNAPLVWSAAANAPTKQAAEVPASDPVEDQRILNERLAAEGIVNSTGRAPFTSYVPTGENLLPINSLGRDMVFAYNAYDPSSVLVEGPITFDLETPGSLTQLAATSSSDFIAGACWADGTWYG